MPTSVRMRGMLDDLQIEDSFVEAANKLNLHAAQGKQFVITRSPEGDNIVLNMHEILVLREYDADSDEVIPSAI